MYLGPDCPTWAHCILLGVDCTKIIKHNAFSN
jgi:hypothetical protein